MICEWTAPAHTLELGFFGGRGRYKRPPIKKNQVDKNSRSLCFESGKFIWCSSLVPWRVVQNWWWSAQALTTKLPLWADLTTRWIQWDHQPPFSHESTICKPHKWQRIPSSKWASLLISGNHFQDSLQWSLEADLLQIGFSLTVCIHFLMTQKSPQAKHAYSSDKMAGAKACGRLKMGPCDNKCKIMIEENRLLQEKKISKDA